MAFGINADFLNTSANFAQNQIQIHTQNLTNLSEIFECMGIILGFTSLVIFALLLGIYRLKIATHFAHFRAEATHQIKINFLSAVPISVLIV